MSELNWDNFHIHFVDVCEHLKSLECPVRRAIGVQLERFTDAIQIIERAEVKDRYLHDDDMKILRESLGENSESLILEEVVKRGEDALKKMQSAIDEARMLVNARPERSP